MRSDSSQTTWAERWLIPTEVVWDCTLYLSLPCPIGPPLPFVGLNPRCAIPSRRCQQCALRTPLSHRRYRFCMMGCLELRSNWTLKNWWLMVCFVPVPVCLCVGSSCLPVCWDGVRAASSLVEFCMYSYYTFPYPWYCVAWRLLELLLSADLPRRLVPYSAPCSPVQCWWTGEASDCILFVSLKR